MEVGGKGTENHWQPL